MSASANARCSSSLTWPQRTSTSAVTLYGVAEERREGDPAQRIDRWRAHQPLHQMFVHDEQRILRRCGGLQALAQRAGRQAPQVFKQLSAVAQCWQCTAEEGSSAVRPEVHPEHGRRARGATHAEAVERTLHDGAT